MKNQFQIISFQEVLKSYKLNEYLFDKGSIQEMKKMGILNLILHHQGDIQISGDLDFNWFLERSFTLFEEYTGSCTILLIIDGNLKVDGDIVSPYDPMIFVTGETTISGNYENLFEQIKTE